MTVQNLVLNSVQTKPYKITIVYPFCTPTVCIVVGVEFLFVQLFGFCSRTSFV